MAHRVPRVQGELTMGCGRTGRRRHVSRGDRVARRTVNAGHHHSRFTARTLGESSGSIAAESRFSACSNFPAAAGVLKSPVRISRFVAFRPYSSLFVSSSGRSVAPVGEMPANTPREREYETTGFRAHRGRSAPVHTIVPAAYREPAAILGADDKSGLFHSRQNNDTRWPVWRWLSRWAPAWHWSSLGALVSNFPLTRSR